MGRRKNPNYFTYEKAKEVVQCEQIYSRSLYWKHWDKYQPIILPRNPQRVFPNFSWNDFLGNDNKFKNTKPRNYRSFEEALAYARTTNIPTVQQWMKTKHPDDIPVRVDAVAAYKPYFKGWKHFLNTGSSKVVNFIDVAKKIEKIQVLAILHQRGSPINVFFINTFPGIGAIKNFCKKSNMVLVRAFKYPLGYDWRSVIGKYGTHYGNHEWIINDVHQLFFDIQIDSF